MDVLCKLHRFFGRVCILCDIFQALSFQESRECSAAFHALLACRSRGPPQEWRLEGARDMFA